MLEAVAALLSLPGGMRAGGVAGVAVVGFQLSEANHLGARKQACQLLHAGLYLRYRGLRVPFTSP